jgi:hypothetical protein
MYRRNTMGGGGFMIAHRHLPGDVASASRSSAPYLGVVERKQQTPEEGAQVDATILPHGAVRSVALLIPAIRFFLLRKLCSYCTCCE